MQILANLTDCPTARRTIEHEYEREQEHEYEHEYEQEKEGTGGKE